MIPRELVGEAIERFGIPGVAVGIVHGEDSEVVERAGHHFLTHGGATNGHQALLVIGTAERFALAVPTNRHGSPSRRRTR